MVVAFRRQHRRMLEGEGADHVDALKVASFHLPGFVGAMVAVEDDGAVVGVLLKTTDHHRHRVGGREGEYPATNIFHSLIHLPSTRHSLMEVTTHRDRIYIEWSVERCESQTGHRWNW